MGGPHATLTRTAKSVTREWSEEAPARPLRSLSTFQTTATSPFPSHTHLGLAMSSGFPGSACQTWPSRPRAGGYQANFSLVCLFLLESKPAFGTKSLSCLSPAGETPFAVDSSSSGVSEPPLSSVCSPKPPATGCSSAPVTTASLDSSSPATPELLSGTVFVVCPCALSAESPLCGKANRLSTPLHKLPLIIESLLCFSSCPAALPSSLHSISVRPSAWSALLHLEKVLHPCHFLALKGLGCAVSITRCRALSTSFPFFCAKPPQRRNTTPSHFLLMTLITASVKRCQPHLACELASLWPPRTVSVALSKSTPRCAHGSRRPFPGARKPGTSIISSL
mmetsp:Transcript_60058/g.139897  ORF Transcript_60058/g.139897 Transcript_60058/m.139897 type:complete len:337 (-) Transcript_60058:915-1925(-)